ncbi:hypothetical protein SCUCBS95973_000225 [Sporothrix curviconia]|uniref:DUF155 domain-containing protein n=1 Tax=Sporothrix curviconia TaxID=1260050 RepID=A0ABP0ANI9_9PEZI
MLSPAIASPSGSRLGRAVISVAAKTTIPAGAGHVPTLTKSRQRVCQAVIHGAGPASWSDSRAARVTPTAGISRTSRSSFSTSSLLTRHSVSDGNGNSKLLDDRGRGASSAAKEARDSKVPGSSSSPSQAAMAAAMRKPRSAGAKHSLRRVAVIAQQQPGSSPPPPSGLPKASGGREDARASGKGVDTAASRQPPLTRTLRSRREAHEAVDEAEDQGALDDGSNVLSAVCLAESFDMVKVMAILQGLGFTLDPDGSGFESHEVVHARKWWIDPAAAEMQPDSDKGWREVDLFVFESGTLVGWGLPADAVDALAISGLVAAAADPFVALRETETLDFRRDASRETSAMRGDVVVLGTRHEAAEGDRLATTRAQIAFSSGLARSTKLAVLEQSFTEYFESTRRIPEILAGRKSDGGGTGGGGLGHISQKFILQKTGELLSLRAQLNHYRELTDALPDIFWDARAELGLEGYYEQVGRALDVGVRIKTLNQKMDYAQEIATVLREISSERHGTRLEWIIIVLIAVEVVFELRRVYLDLQEGDGEKEAAKETAKEIVKA